MRLKIFMTDWIFSKLFHSNTRSCNLCYKLNWDIVSVIISRKTKFMLFLLTTVKFLYNPWEYCQSLENPGLGLFNRWEINQYRIVHLHLAGNNLFCGLPPLPLPPLTCTESAAEAAWGLCIFTFSWKEDTQEAAWNNIANMHLYFCVNTRIHLYSHPTHWYWYTQNFMGVRGGEDMSWHSWQLLRQPLEHAVSTPSDIAVNYYGKFNTNPPHTLLQSSWTTQLWTTLKKLLKRNQKEQQQC